jgi:hypothetical protein
MLCEENHGDVRRLHGMDEIYRLRVGDWRVMTLDELADEAGLPHLPYLEDMPDELEVEWDK